MPRYFTAIGSDVSNVDPRRAPGIRDDDGPAIRLQLFDAALEDFWPVVHVKRDEVGLLDLHFLDGD